MDKIINIDDIKEHKRIEYHASEILEFAKTHSKQDAYLQVLADYKKLIYDISSANYLLNWILSTYDAVDLGEVDNTSINDSIKTIVDTMPTVLDKLTDMVEQIEEIESKK